MTAAMTESKSTNRTDEEQDAESRADSFACQAERRGTGFLREFWFLLCHNKKWWLTPIIVMLLLIALLIVLGGSAAAPFIYTLF